MPDNKNNSSCTPKKGRPREKEKRKRIEARVPESLHAAYLARGGARWLRRILEGL
jgi:hypothetical protein